MLLSFAEGSENLRLLINALDSRNVTEIRSLSGSALSVYASAAVREAGGVHVFVAEDKDTAAWLMNDFYGLLGEENVMFFPAGYKRSVQFGQEDASGIVQRTAALNAIRNFRERAERAEGAEGAERLEGGAAAGIGKNGGAKKSGTKSGYGGTDRNIGAATGHDSLDKEIGAAAGHGAPDNNNNAAAGYGSPDKNNGAAVGHSGPGKNGISGEKPYLIICTYPEALAEKVVGQAEMERQTLDIAAGSKISMEFLAEALDEYGFTRVDFVHEPGQYSRRGGIIDIFSYAENKPYRVDFFGDEVESIRRFDVASQLSIDRLDRVEVVPNLKRAAAAGGSVAFPDFAGDATYWADDLDYALRRVDDIRRKMLADAGEPGEVDNRVTSRKQLLEGLERNTIFVQRDNARELTASSVIEFHTSPQPAFNKQYSLLAKDIHDRSEEGYTTYILSDNKVQTERLVNIFSAEGFPNVKFTPLSLTLHEGFVDNDLKICVYTDHQIFERYHRYSLRGEIDKSQSLTVAELNELKPGDYVVHIDHGVGRFGGLVRSVENGKQHEAVKLEYRDGDVLLVNVHSLHRIARYKDKDSDTPPKVYKLGSGVWQRMKAATKDAVKNIARELIALYAERKAGGGFAFSPDGYLQNELEASFPYEETPDQQQAVDLVKKDMEAPQPMDRLVCGDVGFGKTEVAVRAAFKAVNDSKQVAVLVPTTILSLQHYRTFSERLRGLPVRIENLSRARTSKEVKQITEDLAAGRIDILIGTHKILGKDIKFKSLGLLIIDEEQKFGVAAKEKLRQLSTSVDTMTLTATPIPRTLQFSLMGARDLSVISTPPPNRQPIITESHVFDREVIREAIELELARHGQVFFVHNRVDNIEGIADLVRELVPQARVAVGHGQMPAAKLEKLIMDFIYGEYDVLVATTIIENGIDIPNANTIIINDAQNFGLSDLHQLRGRVGRSNKKSYCYLITPPDELLTSDARRRLKAIEEFSDLGAGFNIAMQDLDIRGAGNLLGAEQSGFIADMGFETYQKILAEAVTELRAEGVAEAGDLIPDGPQQEINYLTDAHIETDTEALLPDGYVGNSGEKIRLYRELDNITDEESMQKFEQRLRDRFGELPPQAVALMDVVRLRWRAVALGFEWVKVKNGLMLARFISDPASPYYKSPLFMSILRYVSERTSKFVLKQNNNKLVLTVRDVKGLREAWQTLEQLTIDN